ncbi:MAG: hypothetical protein ACREMJ_10405 [Gemmatimonadales bacterium]
MPALSFLALAPAPAAAQLAVDQAEIFVHPGAVGQGVVSFHVSNESDQLVEGRVYLGDWDRDEDGENRFLASGTLPQSCARYLRVFPLSLRLPPGTGQAVRISIDGQADTLSAACWSIVFVESSVPPPPGGRQIAYVTRLGVKVYLVPSGLTDDGEVADMAVRAGVVEVRFHNTGGTPLWVGGGVEYRRLDNSVAASDSIPQFPVLPGADRRVRRRVPPLAPGRYVVLALLDYGGAEIAAGRASVEVP